MSELKAHKDTKYLAILKVLYTKLVILPANASYLCQFLMEIIHTADRLISYLKLSVPSQNRLGFVPTMGALHKGHLSLFKRSTLENDVTIGSIFVNPLQFNNQTDLIAYPKPLERDLELLEQNYCDAVFLPSPDQIYPTTPIVTLNFGYLENIMEGKFRPGHFNGVGVILSKLFNIVKPDNAYFGQKDLQQVAVVRQLVKDLSFQIAIHTCPIIRENNGLAMSSRNARLSTKEKTLAGKIHESLLLAKESLTYKSVNEVYGDIEAYYQGYPEIKLEYFEIVDKDSLLKADSSLSKDKIAFCIAAYIGEVRLIDNLFYSSI